MSDLISRKKIRDYIKGEINPYGKPFEGTAYELGLKIMRYVDAMDSDYDVEKVVEELDETMQDLSVIEIFSHIDFDRTIQSGLDNFLKAYNSELLRIVKNGGVYDDVCEWKYTSDGEFIQNPHTKRLYSNEPSMKNVYCNTCGKKIKAVEWWSNDN